MEAASRVAEAREEGARAAQASSDAAVAVARDALTEALQAAQAEARAREGEAVSGAGERRELHADVIRWRSQAEESARLLHEHRAAHEEHARRSDERISALNEQVRDLPTSHIYISPTSPWPPQASPTPQAFFDPRADLGCISAVHEQLAAHAKLIDKAKAEFVAELEARGEREQRLAGANAEEALSTALAQVCDLPRSAPPLPCPSQAFSSLLRPSQAFSGLLRPSQAISGHLRPSQAVPGHLRPSQAFSDVRSRRGPSRRLRRIGQRSAWSWPAPFTMLARARSRWAGRSTSLRS